MTSVTDLAKLNPPKVRRGDLVALETSKSVTYAIGSGIPGETNAHWTIVRVASASRDGIVKSVEEIGYSTVRKLEHMCGKPRVHCLPNHQDAAQRLISSIPSDEWWKGWDSAEALKAAIVAA